MLFMVDCEDRTEREGVELERQLLAGRRLERRGSGKRTNGPHDASTIDWRGHGGQTICI